ncbi:MAG: CpaD family pilus assembly protein [Hyphomonadaceae bacterium]|nr:CpaD family pilus assembly protein [Hyphomonadaceae bacterium]
MNVRLPFFLIGLSALGACASVPPPPPGPATPTVADQHRITVTQTAERIELPVSAGDVSLSPAAQAQLRAFAAGYLRYGHGALVLSAPSGSDNSDAASQVADDTRRALVEAGVSYAAVAGSTYDASGTGSAPIIVSFSRFEAQPAECAPLWEQDLAHQSNNQPWASFGCATMNNLAALVEDPADLLRPRAEDPRDSGRRGTVLDAYREGEQTHAERSSDERIQISNAVQ